MRNRLLPSLFFSSSKLKLIPCQNFLQFYKIAKLKPLHNLGNKIKASTFLEKLIMFIILLYFTEVLA